MPSLWRRLDFTHAHLVCIISFEWTHERSNLLINERSSWRAIELPLDALAVDRNIDEPIQRQIYAALRDLILRRILPPGLRLPSTRELAKDIVVSRNTVVAAYDQLASEGYIESRQGAHTFVVDLPLQPARPAPASPLSGSNYLSRAGRLMMETGVIGAHPHENALRASTPDVESFPFKTWNRLLARRFKASNTDLFSYNYVSGYPPLQQAIASYLQAYRGVRCEPEQVVITSGAQGALDLIARLLLSEGDTVWMEEPGYFGAQVLFSAVGARLEPMNVDENGWDLGSVPDGPVRLIYTTPSCQQPLGQTMLMEQRLRLLDIARQKNAWIIEDDFDSEYRLAGTSVPSMQGIDTAGRTIYVGTFAKTLFPALRIGFMVLPQPIDADIGKAIFASGHLVSLPLQATLSDFIESGQFARHLRRTRRLYGQRRALFLSLIDTLLGDWLEPIEADVGIQIAFRFKRDMDDQSLARRANERRLNVTPLSRHYLHGAPTHGLVLGYAALDERQMRLHLTELRNVFEDSG